MLTERSYFAVKLREALQAEGAQVLSYSDHIFPGTSGLTGIFLLAESHASFHTWPEYHLMCLDIFSCGAMEPQKVLDRLAAALPFVDVEVTTSRRGAQLFAREVPSEG